MIFFPRNKASFLELITLDFSSRPKETFITIAMTIGWTGPTTDPTHHSCPGQSQSATNYPKWKANPTTSPHATEHTLKSWRKLYWHTFFRQVSFQIIFNFPR